MGLSNPAATGAEARAAYCKTAGALAEHGCRAISAHGLKRWKFVLAGLPGCIDVFLSRVLIRLVRPSATSVGKVILCYLAISGD